jgi:hypothetical protein
MIHLYTKYNLNPSNHRWKNEQKLSFSRSFLNPRAIHVTSPIMIGPYPYSNVTCIFSWYISKANILWIHQTITEKMNRNCHNQEWRADGRTDGQTSPYHIIRPVFNGRIKMEREKTTTFWIYFQLAFSMEHSLDIDLPINLFCNLKFDDITHFIYHIW